MQKGREWPISYFFTDKNQWKTIFRNSWTILLVITEVVGESCRHVDLPHQRFAPQCRVLRSSLQQKNLVVRIFSQPVCENTSSTSSANYHLIIFFGLPSRGGETPPSR